MFKNLTEHEKEERFNGLMNYADKINNTSLKKVKSCTEITRGL